MRRLLPRQKEGVIVQLVGECHEVLGAFMRGQLLVMLGARCRLRDRADGAWAWTWA